MDQFLVRWAGYGEEGDTWEPLINVYNCSQFEVYLNGLHPGISDLLRQEVNRRFPGRQVVAPQPVASDEPPKRKRGRPRKDSAPAPVATSPKPISATSSKPTPATNSRRSSRTSLGQVEPTKEPPISPTVSLEKKRPATKAILVPAQEGTPRKRGRPRKYPVSVAPVESPEESPEESPVETPSTVGSTPTTPRKRGRPRKVPVVTQPEPPSDPEPPVVAEPEEEDSTQVEETQMEVEEDSQVVFETDNEDSAATIVRVRRKQPVESASTSESEESSEGDSESTSSSPVLHAGETSLSEGTDLMNVAFSVPSLHTAAAKGPKSSSFPSPTRTPKPTAIAGKEDRSSLIQASPNLFSDEEMSEEEAPMEFDFSPPIPVFASSPSKTLSEGHSSAHKVKTPEKGPTKTQEEPQEKKGEPEKRQETECEPEKSSSNDDLSDYFALLADHAGMVPLSEHGSSGVSKGSEPFPERKSLEEKTDADTSEDEEEDSSKEEEIEINPPKTVPTPQAHKVASDAMETSTESGPVQELLPPELMEELNAKQQRLVSLIQELDPATNQKFLDIISMSMDAMALSRALSNGPGAAIAHQKERAQREAEQRCFIPMDELIRTPIPKESPSKGGHGTPSRELGKRRERTADRHSSHPGHTNRPLSSRPYKDLDNPNARPDNPPKKTRYH
jgi:hypothetical protein